MIPNLERQPKVLIHVLGYFWHVSGYSDGVELLDQSPIELGAGVDLTVRAGVPAGRRHRDDRAVLHVHDGGLTSSSFGVSLIPEVWTNRGAPCCAETGAPVIAAAAPIRPSSIL